MIDQLKIQVSWTRWLNLRISKDRAKALFLIFLWLDFSCQIKIKTTDNKTYDVHLGCGDVRALERKNRMISSHVTYEIKQYLLITATSNMFRRRESTCSNAIIVRTKLLES